MAKAQFLIAIRGMMSNYDDIHAYLRPGGRWAPEEWVKTAYPQSGEEWARVELYMGTFEFAETMISRKLLDVDEFRRMYQYRLRSIINNPEIVEKKLIQNRESWRLFLDICKRYDVRIPGIDE